ncbi:N-acetylneuraminate lyase-like [Leptopilina heterotoma]|uniref:N-acetylneuraminate lyase-like n=1 Tax=Leptopilina heterotoma TaxID=63436 RepID=UPI001CA835BE|nr:N-acetylneuraminate lyase-like [Leptopilina heterotoma]
MLVEEFILRGILVAALTPYNYKDTLSLNLTVIPDYVQYLEKKGVAGVLIGATTGEGQALSVPERKSLAEEWMKAIKSTKLHLMVHIGGAPLPEVLELARHAEKLHVDSLLTLPELYFRPSNEKELATYLKLVSDAAPNTPLLYYHTPQRAPVKGLNIAEFLENYGNLVPTLVGIKYSNTDLSEVAQALEARNRNYTILFGAEKLIYPACALGVEAFISASSNLFPELPLTISEAWKNKDFEKAKKHQELFTKSLNVYPLFGNQVQGIKLAMRHLTPFDFGDARIPWNRISAEKEIKLVKELQKEVVDKMEFLGIK